jgi:RimJ/RimL family protein N-acetyltransferase
MGPAFLRASLSGDLGVAEESLGAELPRDWPKPREFLEMRLRQLEEDPALEPWLTRAIVLEAGLGPSSSKSRRRGAARSSSAPGSRVVGVSGFHGPPGGAWLRDYAPEGVEFGYTVYREYRRQGIAYEASVALMEWAAHEHGVTQFVLSMLPHNEASAGLAIRLGFSKVGEWQHEKRGLEHVYRRRVRSSDLTPGRSDFSS